MPASYSKLPERHLQPKELFKCPMQGILKSPKQNNRQRDLEKEGTYSPARRGLRNFKSVAYKENFPIRHTEEDQYIR